MLEISHFLLLEALRLHHTVFFHSKTRQLFTRLLFIVIVIVIA